MADQKINNIIKKAKGVSKAASEKLNEYYSNLPIDQETKNNAKIIAGEASEKAKNIFKIIYLLLNS